MEAGVDPGFEELSEQEAAPAVPKGVSGLAGAAAGRGFAGVAAGVRAACRGGMAGTIRRALDQLQRAGWKLVEWRDYPAPWRRDPFAREAEIDTLARMTRDLAAMSSRPRRVTDDLYRGLAPARALCGMDRAGRGAGDAGLRRAGRAAAEAGAGS